MHDHDSEITLPELALVAGTRAMLGAGLGLLLADKLSKRQRRGPGWALFAVGAFSTIPLAARVLGKRCSRRAKDASDPLDTAPMLKVPQAV